MMQLREKFFGGNLMTISLGRYKVLREFKLEIDKDGKIFGHMDLIFRGKIALSGKISHFNDVELYEYAPPPVGERFSRKFTDKRTKKSLKLLPVKLHFRCKKFYNENDYIDFGTDQKFTAREYANRFKGDKQEISDRITINKDLDLLMIETASKPYNDDWRASVYLFDVEILESKNVPGLKDVPRKGDNK